MCPLRPLDERDQADGTGWLVLVLMTIAMIVLVGSAIIPKSTGPQTIGLIVLGALVGLPLYLIPTFVALGRDHRDKTPIIVLNLILGATVIGWGAALVWACWTPESMRARGGHG